MVDFTDPAAVGIGLMGLGVVMFLLEAMMPGFFIAVPATILLLLGIVSYNTPPESFATLLKFAPLLVVVTGAPATWITIKIYGKMAPPSESPTTRSSDKLVGETGIVTRLVEPDSMRGKVRVSREIWSATTTGAPIPEGVRVRIVRIEGVVITVQPVEGA